MIYVGCLHQTCVGYLLSRLIYYKVEMYICEFYTDGRRRVVELEIIL